VFAHNEKNISVILLRYKHSELDEIIKIVTKQLELNLNNFIGNFVTITTKNIRIRKI
jgi:hypothetical protein